MKSICIASLLALIGLACGMTDTQKAYIDGINDGFYLGELAWQARGNTTAAQLYNQEILKYNAFLNSTLNESEYALEELAPIPEPDLSWYPEILKQPFEDPWE